MDTDGADISDDEVHDETAASLQAAILDRDEAMVGLCCLSSWIVLCSSMHSHTKTQSTYSIATNSPYHETPCICFVYRFDVTRY